MSNLKERIEAATYRQMKRFFFKFVSIVGLGIIILIFVLIFVAADYAGHR